MLRTAAGSAQGTFERGARGPKGRPRSTAPERGGVAGLVREEPALRVEARGVPAEGSARLDDPVARDEDRHRVVVVRAADRTGAPGPAEEARDLAVAPHLAPRNGAERLPDAELE